MRNPYAPHSEDLLRWLAEEFASGLARVLESVTGNLPAVETGSDAIPAEDLPDVAGAKWFQFRVEGNANAALAVGARESHWFRIGKCSLDSIGLQDASDADAQNTCQEVLQQVVSGLAGAVAGRAGRRVDLSAAVSVARPPESMPLRAIAVNLGGEESVRIFFGADPALEAVMKRGDASEELAKEQATALDRSKLQLPAATSPPENFPPSPPLNSQTLDLLMDVELPVSISFGRTRATLRDVLKLTSGSIVELDRTISEPVDLVINDRTIARGEVVVVEGNYGIRINEIISRQERLRTVG